MERVDILPSGNKVDYAEIRPPRESRGASLAVRAYAELTHATKIAGALLGILAAAATLNLPRKLAAAEIPKVCDHHERRCSLGYFGFGRYA